MELRTILFYDGVCGLCDRTVQFLLSHSKLPAASNGTHELFFSALQGLSAHSLLLENDRAHLSSLVLLENGQLHRKSSAVARLSKYVRFPWNILLGVVRWIPTPFANLGYDLVASIRYKIFGQLESCRIPRPNEQKHFLP
jgi:predicted DCC family thiol-disulfide oxidoreductase YuxK